MKEIIKAKLAAHGVTDDEFYGDSTEARVVQARRSVILALSDRGLSNREIAKLIGRHIHTVRYWLNFRNREKRIRDKAAARAMGGPRQTKQQRDEILRAYLSNPAEGTALAISRGLAPLYAYKLANMMGVLPKTRWPSHDHL